MLSLQSCIVMISTAKTLKLANGGDCQNVMIIPNSCVGHLNVLLLHMDWAFKSAL